MAMAIINHNGEIYTGRTIESIARRIWGRTASVEISPDPNNRSETPNRDIVFAQAMITRTDKYGTHVLAEVTVYPNH